MYRYILYHEPSMQDNNQEFQVIVFKQWARDKETLHMNKNSVVVSI